MSGLVSIQEDLCTYMFGTEGSHAVNRALVAYGGGGDFGHRGRDLALH